MRISLIVIHDLSFCLYVCIYITCMCGAQRPEQNIIPPGTRIKDACELGIKPGSSTGATRAP